MKIFIVYDTDDYKATIDFRELVELFELTDEQINSVRQIVKQKIRTM